MDDKRNRVLEYAWKRFMESGYSGVTMDDIARGCGYGKATVYKLFDSKETLLLRSIEFFAEKQKLIIGSTLDDKTVRPDEKLGRIMKPLLTALSHVNASTLDDIRRNAPEAYRMIDSKRREMIFKNITAIIAEGKKSGDFRADINPALVANIIIGAVSHAVNPVIIESLNLTPSQILDNIVSIIINGCRPSRA